MTSGERLSAEPSAQVCVDAAVRNSYFDRARAAGRSRPRRRRGTALSPRAVRAAVRRCAGPSVRPRTARGRPRRPDETINSI